MQCENSAHSSTRQQSAPLHLHLGERFDVGIYFVMTNSWICVLAGIAHRPRLVSKGLYAIIIRLRNTTSSSAAIEKENLRILHSANNEILGRFGMCALLCFTFAWRRLINCVDSCLAVDGVHDIPHTILVYCTRENGTNPNMARSLFDSIHNDTRLWEGSRDYFIRTGGNHVSVSFLL